MPGRLVSTFGHHQVLMRKTGSFYSAKRTPDGASRREFGQYEHNGHLDELSEFPNSR